MSAEGNGGSVRLQDLSNSFAPALQLNQPILASIWYKPLAAGSQLGIMNLMTNTNHGSAYMAYDVLNTESGRATISSPNGSINPGGTVVNQWNHVTIYSDPQVGAATTRFAVTLNCVKTPFDVALADQSALTYDNIMIMDGVGSVANHRAAYFAVFTPADEAAADALSLQLATTTLDPSTIPGVQYAYSFLNSSVPDVGTTTLAQSGGVTFDPDMPTLLVKASTGSPMPIVVES